MGSVTEALSGVSERVRILLVPQYNRVGKGLNYWPVPATPTSIFQAARLGFSCARDDLSDYRRSNSRSRLAVGDMRPDPRDVRPGKRDAPAVSHPLGRIARANMR